LPNIYSDTSKSFSGAIGLGGRASAIGAQRPYIEELYRIKAQQRSAMFGTLAQLLGIGSTLWDRQAENKELISTARKYGFEPAGGKFKRIFGTGLKFTKDGQTYEEPVVRAMDQYQNYIKEKNLLETVFGGY